MDIVIHDYGAYAFPIELSRELARRGHNVAHLFCEEVNTGKGDVQPHGVDGDTTRFVPVAIGRPMEKYSVFKRFPLEWRYGRNLRRELLRESPQIVVSANTPLVAHLAFRLGLPRRMAVIVWQQDLVSTAMAEIIGARVAIARPLARLVLTSIEAQLCRSAAAVVAISDSFRSVLLDWRVEPTKIFVIHNWAPIADIPVRQKVNAWSSGNIDTTKLTFLYSGTLGMKHNPAVLQNLASELTSADGQVVVVSEGLGADWLKKHSVEASAVVVRPFAPYADFPDVLAAADVLVVLLEQEASTYSVPSKVLSYMCAGRPIIAVVPSTNLAAQIIQEEGAGLVVDANVPAALGIAVRDLVRSSATRDTMSKNARKYAEQTFRIDSIADRFEKIFAELNVADVD